MIKFFRNIRQNLLKEGKTANYLKYAIGEIILVVIGILIALQINNWNQQRQDRILEKDYYCQFLEDVNQDFLQLKEQTDATKLRLHHANAMLGQLQKEDSDFAEIMEHVKGSVSKTDAIIEPNKNAFEDLKSSGNLRLITDKNLKTKLSEYYSIEQNLLDVVNSNAISTTNRFKNKTDRLNNGWVLLIEQNKGFDTSLVSLEQLKKIAIRDEQVTLNLMNDALAYIGANSRNLILLKSLENEITTMKTILEFKCKKQ